MKKFAALALAAAFATSTAPAMALEVPTSDSYLSIAPCFFDCLDGGVIDATDGTLSESFEITGIPDSPFTATSRAAEYNAVTGFAFFVIETGELFTFDVLNETGLDLIASNASLPTVDGDIIGLALDDSTDTLYALYNDPDAQHFYVVTVDQVTGSIGTPLEMPFSLTMAGAQEFAASGGNFYFLTGVEQVKIFSVSDGSFVGSIAYPMGANPFFAGYAIDVSEGGVLRVATRNTDTSIDEFFSYDIAAGTWSDATPAVADYYTTYDGVAWFGSGSEPAPEALAETGFEPFGIALASLALIGTGGAVALRRRARR